MQEEKEEGNVILGKVPLDLTSPEFYKMTNFIHFCFSLFNLIFILLFFGKVCKVVGGGSFVRGKGES